MGQLSGNAETVKGPGFDTTVGKMKDMGYSQKDISELNPQLNSTQKAAKGGMGALSGALQGYGQDQQQLPAQIQSQPYDPNAFSAKSRMMFFGGN